MKNVLTEIDKTLLEVLQKDFPLVSRPFDHFAGVCGISEEEVILRIKKLISEGIIREISAIFNAGRLGYKSTLVALRAPEGLEDNIAGIINRHPGVSHNYFRNYKYNLWFTLVIMEETGFKEELEKLLEGAGDAGYLILPAIRTFKIGVDFKLTDGTKPGKAYQEKPETENAETGPEQIVKTESLKAKTGPSGRDKKIIMNLQEHMKIVQRPWKEMSFGLGMSETELLGCIKDFKDKGAIKRISAVLRHRKIGYTANGMACFNISDEKIEQAGNTLAQYPEVSHCYQRKTCPDWKYSMFAMVHCRGEEECRSIAREMSKQIGCPEHIVLFSTKEYKKERVKYFME